MSRYTMCPRCGHRMRRDRDWSGEWDGMTYVCDFCQSDGEYYDDGEPDNDFCRQCGNSDEWPECKSFCGIFDE